MDYFIIQSYKINNRGCNSSRHNILTIIKNVGKNNNYKNNKKNFLKPQYNDRKQVLKKKILKKKNLPQNKAPHRGQYI